MLSSLYAWKYKLTTLPLVPCCSSALVRNSAFAQGWPGITLFSQQWLKTRRWHNFWLSMIEMGTGVHIRVEILFIY